MIGDGSLKAKLEREGVASKSSADTENSLKELIDAELSKIKRRVEDLEDAQSLALPIVALTPADDLEHTKEKVNFLINYLNLGIRYD